MPENSLPPPEEREDWKAGEPSRLVQSGKAACVQCWIYLTFLRLTKAGLDLRLCHKIPEEGMVVALTGNLMPGFQPPKGVYLIGVVADGSPHPACHFHILQNAAHAGRLPRSAYIPLWPQPGLIPRDPARGERFENIVFYGDPPNLAPELRAPSFSKLLKNRFDLNFQLAGADRWHDYSETDCVLAIREFGSRPFLRKPATKLYNAWMAGVPMIGGMDSAFTTDGREGIDYMRSETLEQLWSTVERLKDDPDCRERMISEGRCSARRFTPEAITGRWRDLLHFLATTEAPLQLKKATVMKTLSRWMQRVSLAGDSLKGGY